MFIRPPFLEYHTVMLRRMERIVRSAKMRIVEGASSHGAKAPGQWESLMGILEKVQEMA